jgi:predicted nucleic acid-binding protein
LINATHLVLLSHQPVQCRDRLGGLLKYYYRGAHAELTLQDGDVVAAALGRFRARPTLGFSDCLVLEIAREAGHLPLGTFDRRLAKLDGAQRL